MATNIIIHTPCVHDYQPLDRPEVKVTNHPHPHDDFRIRDDGFEIVNTHDDGGKPSSSSSTPCRVRLACQGVAKTM